VALRLQVQRAEGLFVLGKILASTFQRAWPAAGSGRSPGGCGRHFFRDFRLRPGRRQAGNPYADAHLYAVGVGLAIAGTGQDSSLVVARMDSWSFQITPERARNRRVRHSLSVGRRQPGGTPRICAVRRQCAFPRPRSMHETRLESRACVSLGSSANASRVSSTRAP